MTDGPTNQRTYRHRHQWRTTTRQAVLAKTGGLCGFCGWPGTDGQGKGLQLAHVVPHDQGGTDTEENLIPLCGTCHAQFDAGRRAGHTQGAP